jgi:transcriptional regulator with XRE-family HTH domain
MIENEIALRIQTLLDAKSVKLAEVARQASVPYHTIANLWRRPKARLSADNADKLAAALGTTARFILFGETPAPEDRRALVMSMYDDFDETKRRQMEEYALFLASRRAQSD